MELINDYEVDVLLIIFILTWKKQATKWWEISVWMTFNRGRLWECSCTVDKWMKNYRECPLSLWFIYFIELTHCDRLPVRLKLFHSQVVLKCVALGSSVHHITCECVRPVCCHQQWHITCFRLNLPTLIVCFTGKFHCWYNYTKKHC